MGTHRYHPKMIKLLNMKNLFFTSRFLVAIALGVLGSTGLRANQEPQKANTSTK